MKSVIYKNDLEIQLLSYLSRIFFLHVKLELTIKLNN